MTVLMLLSLILAVAVVSPPILKNMDNIPEGRLMWIFGLFTAALWIAIGIKEWFI